MRTIVLEPAAGPPPPPPPIYLGKTGGSKKLVGSNLYLTIECSGELAEHLTERGAILWLHGPLGTWYTGSMSGEDFAGECTVSVCVIDTPVDHPQEIRIQPLHLEDDGAQNVEMSDAA